MENKKNNKMYEIRIEKVTLHCGTGANPNDLEQGIKLLKLISKRKAVKTLSKSRIPAFGTREGLPIGCKVTIRGKNAAELL